MKRRTAASMNNPNSASSKILSFPGVLMKASNETINAITPNIRF